MGEATIIGYELRQDHATKLYAQMPIYGEPEEGDENEELACNDRQGEEAEEVPETVSTEADQDGDADGETPRLCEAAEEEKAVVKVKSTRKASTKPRKTRAKKAKGQKDGRSSKKTVQRGA